VPAAAAPTFTPGAAAAVPATGSLPPVSFDQLLDFNVVDASGNLIGEVKDAAIERGAANAAAGQISYLVVDSSLKSDWEIPVPWQYVTVRPDLMAVMLPVNATQLASAPGFNDELWPANLAGPNNVVQTFWSNPGQAAAMAPVLPSGLGGGFLRASDVSGVDILSPQGVKLGEIKDLAVDWKNSQAGAPAAQFSYLVMEMNDDLGFQNRMIPIPWRLVRINPGQENAIVNIAQAQVLTAPNFLQGGMPDLYSEPLLSQLRQFWPQ
jgi:sporulation protein YlmC with PRC-barrel domain